MSRASRMDDQGFDRGIPLCRTVRLSGLQTKEINDCGGLPGMKSYFVNFNGGQGKYFRKLRDARKAFKQKQTVENGSVYGEESLPVSLEIHKLLPDCFERCYNSEGGFVEEVLVIESRE